MWPVEDRLFRAGASRETSKEAAVVELKHLQKLHQACG